MNTATPSTNANIRQIIKNHRKQLTARQSQKAACHAFGHLSHIARLLPKNANIGVYCNAFGELPTYPLIRFCQLLGHTPFLPVVADDILRFVAFYPKNRANSDMVFDSLPKKRHTLGMNEPIGPYIDVKKLAAIFCPLIAIDKQGNRLGMGGGFYDRSLCNYHGIKIGYCYDFQIVPRIFANSWDIGMDYIVSDKRFLLC